MKAKVNGVEVEGTPEEIARILGIQLSPVRVIDYDFIPDPCKNCPNYRKGPCHCTLGGMDFTCF